MVAYKVTVLEGRAQIPLVVPCGAADATVGNLVESIIPRAAAQGLTIAQDTHTVCVRLDQPDGAILHHEDRLCDLLSPSDKIFAIFTAKSTKQESNSASDAAVANQIASQLSASSLDDDRLLIRFITPALAKQDRASIQPVSVSKSATTIKQLHELAAEHLGLPTAFDISNTRSECNCTLAKHLAASSSLRHHTLLVHGKSAVLRLQKGSEADTQEAIAHHLGAEFLATKKLQDHGGVFSACCTERHVPIHARIEDPEESERKHRVIDLHTSEMPISASAVAAGVCLGEVGLPGLAVDGVVDIYVVHRLTAGLMAGSSLGKSGLFRSYAHWQPEVTQTARGEAMFLSSLRVFSSIIQAMDRRSGDAVLHVLDLLTRFPPALRAFRILMENKVITAVESAAVSHATYEMLKAIIIPNGIVGTSYDRVMEGARLLFGFILEKARTLKLAELNVVDDELPYMLAFKSIEVKDDLTNEPIVHAVATDTGLMEKSLADAFTPEGVLANTSLRSNLLQFRAEPQIARVALLNAGSPSSEVMVFNAASLRDNYRYSDNGEINAAIDMSQTEDLSHLAELAGRNQLAVYRPTQLSSAVAPCLTFDRNAHLGVYTGQQPCGIPGQSSLVFRPRHGEATINATIIEQLIAPIIKQYESEGTDVFDALGGSIVRKLTSPDEVLVFCVDTSASMRSPSDFDIHEPAPFYSPELTADGICEVEYYTKASLEEIRDSLVKYEAFEDIVSIIAETRSNRQRNVASEVLHLLRTLLGREMVLKHETLEKRRASHYARFLVPQLQTELTQLKSQWAGIQTHEQALVDFLVYRANSSPSVNSKWQWSLGEELPANSSPSQIPQLPSSLTEVPHDLRCPVSHDLMENAVVAADGKTYSREAIEAWFAIRASSPMTGLPLGSTSLTDNDDISTAVANWINGVDMLETPQPPQKKARLDASGPFHVTFLSKEGRFGRKIPADASMNDVYKIAFRALRARINVFQLALDEATVLRPSSARAVASGITDRCQIIVRIAEDENMVASSSSTSNSRVTEGSTWALIKVFSQRNMLFSFWVKRDITQATIQTIIWKYWRFNFRTTGRPGRTDFAIWSDMVSSGDGYFTGSPCTDSTNLAQLLNVSHCHGKLEDESVANDRSGTRSANQPLVLKVAVDRRVTASARQEDRGLSRLDVLKQLFETSVNRTISYGYKQHMALITFASEARVASPISHVIENLRRSTVDMEADGDTALWDAIALAKDQIDDYVTKYPKAKKRIVVISDGEDTKSDPLNTPAKLTWALRQANIVVDSIALGNEQSRDLRSMSYFSGGYKFQPASLTNALAITELEPYLSLSERPDVVRAASTQRDFSFTFEIMKYTLSPTVLTPDSVPPRKQHDNVNDSFVELAAVAKRPSVQTGPSSSSFGGGSQFRSTRLLNELKAIAANAESRSYDIFVSERNMFFLKVVLSGPVGSPYENGTFVVMVDCGHANDRWPLWAPEVRFLTRVYHPNVNAHGRVCIGLLSRDWTSDITLSQLIDSIYALLYQAEASDSINTATTLDYHHDQVDFAEEARAWVRKYASKSREQWRKKILEEDEDEDGAS